MGQSGREVISLQKEDSLLVFERIGKLKRFVQYGKDFRFYFTLLL
jgi:hypothetical protein